jgi:hypothetical protein
MFCQQSFFRIPEWGMGFNLSASYLPDKFLAIEPEGN